MELFGGRLHINRKSARGALRICLIVFVSVVLIIVGFTGYKQWQKSKIIIPNDIKKQVTSTVFWPEKNSPVVGDKSTIKYDSENKLLSYVVRTSDGTKIVVSEQPAPDAFADFPQTYVKFAEDLRQYSSFENSNGKVYLTHPKELKGGQTAIMYAKGTLMLLRPDKDISDDTWKQIFNNLDVIQ